MKPVDLSKVISWSILLNEVAMISAQTPDGTWVWLGGNNTIHQPGIYETLGIASFNSLPGARFGHSMVMDPSSDSLFVFGGYGIGLDPARMGKMNDMWMFNIASGWWTWLSGDGTGDRAGIYETKGKASINSRPGGRDGHSMVLHPSGQFIYVFAGHGFTAEYAAYLNDLWMFNVTSGYWTWVAGQSSLNRVGNYGIKRVASENSRPGARSSHSMVMDPSGQSIFVFGGYGLDSSSHGLLNDMWIFNLTSGWWTWLSGGNTVDQKGIYGIQQLASWNSRPGARKSHSMVMDPSRQSFYVFGGSGYDTENEGYLNDLWIFYIKSGLWTWLSGFNTTNQEGVYGTQGTISPSNQPGARQYHSMVIFGQSLFLFGGSGYGSLPTSGYLNDMWMFSVNTRSWVWLSGDSNCNQPGLYGTPGTTSATSRPGARRENTMAIHPSGRTMFVFGGWGHGKDTRLGSLNDLWMFFPPANLLESTIDDVSFFPPVKTISGGVPVATHKPVVIRNIWLESMAFALSVIIALTVALFQIGFVAGYLNGKRKTKQIFDDNSSMSPSTIDSDASSYSYSTDSSSAYPYSDGKSTISNYAAFSSHITSEASTESNAV